MHRISVLRNLADFLLELSKVRILKRREILCFVPITKKEVRRVSR